MSKKPDQKKNRNAGSKLGSDESLEVGMILDRLAVQDPEGTSLENYLKSLVKSLANRESIAAAIIEQLSRTPSKVAFQAFMALKDTIRDKKLIRIVKQVGYRFSQRGFSVEPRMRLSDNVVLVQKQDKKPVAHVLPVDGTFWLFAALIPEAAYPAPTLVTALMEQDFAQVYVRVLEGSQKIYRDYLQKVGERHADRKPCEVPLYHAARLFFELLDFSRNKETTPEQGRASSLLKPFHAPEKQPYAYDLMPSVEDPRKRLEEVNETELLKAVDWSWLILPKEELAPYCQKMRDLENPILVIPKEIQEDRTSDLIKTASDDLCEGKTRWLYQRFFEEQALWLQLSSKDDLAMSAWIVAQHLQAGARAGDNPIVRELVLLSMHHHWPDDLEKEERRGEPFHRTESGLIVPS
jgi:hypothetical protein